MYLIEIEKDLCVNLDKVANVNVLKDKFVFNMSYSVDIDNIGKISDYYYINKDKDDFINSKYFRENFIKIVGLDREVYINKNHISYIMKEYKNNKLIIGFSHSVQGRNIKDNKTIAEHMYIKMDFKETLDNMFNILKQNLKV